MFRATTFLLGFLCCISALATDQAMQVSYSGLMTLETAAGVMKGPVAAMPGKQRREFDMNGEPVVTITRFDKGVNWMLMPGQKMYTETKLDADSTADAGAVAGYDIQYTDEGPDTVNGVATTKSKIVMTAADGSKFGGFAWRTGQSIVVRLDALAISGDAKQRIKMDLTDLKVEPQDDALFEIPAGFSSMNLGGMMMQGMPGMDQMQNGSETSVQGDGAEGTGSDAPPPKKKWGLKDAFDLVK